MIEDIINQKFGNLIAIEKIEEKNNEEYWLFKCDCGKEKILQLSYVKNHSINNCGCNNKDNKIKIKTCEICGQDFLILDFRQHARKYCFNCSPSTNNPTSKTKAMKEKIIEMKGGRCERCGYNKCIEALEFHHIDPSKKEFKLSNTGGAPSYEKFLAEANKCILLCANCHREEHWRLRQKEKEK